MGSPMVVTSGQQYNVGEKPTVILYTYINRHAEPPNITREDKGIIVLIIIDDNSTIKPYQYKNKRLGQQ